MSFVQPDTDQRNELRVFAPGFLTRDTPRFEMYNVGCYFATTCLDMLGNSGGARIRDLDASAFAFGVSIDGALDTVRFDGLHWFPFAMTIKQLRLFSSQAADSCVALDVGRADDLKISEALFEGGLATRVYHSKLGSAFMTISQADFDGLSGNAFDEGIVQISNSFFSLGSSSSRAILQEGGILTVNNSTYIFAKSSDIPAVEPSAGNMILSSNHFESGAYDITIVNQLSGSYFSWKVTNS